MITNWYILENFISVYLLNLLICLKLHMIWRSLLKQVFISGIRSIFCLRSAMLTHEQKVAGKETQVLPQQAH